SPGTGVRIATQGVPDANATGQPATGAADDFSGVNTANLPKSSGKVDFPPLASGYKSKSLANGGLLVENPEHQEFYYYLDGNNILQIQYVGVASSSPLSNVSLGTSSFNDEESLMAHLRSTTAIDGNGSSSLPAPGSEPAPSSGAVRGPVRIMGPLDISADNINLNELVQSLVRFNPYRTSSDVPGVSEDPANQPEESPAGTAQPGSSVRAKPRFELGRGYTIDFGLRYSRFENNNRPTTTVPDAVTKPDSSRTNRTPSPSPNQKGHLSL